MPHPASVLAETGACTATVAIAPPPYTLQSAVRRWLASDVYEYDVDLRVWDGKGFVDLSPHVHVVLQQKVTTPQSQAVFTNLKEGHRYQATVSILGNAGGTAATTTLNAQSAVPQPIFDFTALQDVQDTQSASYQPQLDPMPFSGTATLVPQNPPAGTDSYTAVLKDAASGTTLSSLSYSAAQQGTFSNLQAGRGYQVVLQAYQGGTLLAGAPAVSLSWDLAAPSLEQSVGLAVSF